MIEFGEMRVWSKRGEVSWIYANTKGGRSQP